MLLPSVECNLYIIQIIVTMLKKSIKKSNLMSCSLRLCLKDMQWVIQIYYLSNTNLYLESICNF